MTFASMAIALPITALVALVAGWWFCRLRMSSPMAGLWSCSIGVLIGIAMLLSDGPAGLVRAIWPREAVDWLALAGLALAAVAQLQTRPVRLGRASLIMGVLLGTLIVCRLLYGSIYLRMGNTSPASLMAIALCGIAIGLNWHLELVRARERNLYESLVCLALALGSSAALGMSGSFQYGIIGLLVTLSACASWIATRSWPWIGNTIIGLLLGLGAAFAELSLANLIVLGLALLGCSGLALIPAQGSYSRGRIVGVCFIGCVIAGCVGLVTYQFLQDVKGNNSSNGGYEAYK